MSASFYLSNLLQCNGGIIDATTELQIICDCCNDGDVLRFDNGIFRITNEIVIHKSIYLLGPGTIIGDFPINFSHGVFFILANNVSIDSLNIEISRCNGSVFNIGKNISGCLMQRCNIKFSSQINNNIAFDFKIREPEINIPEIEAGFDLL